MSALLLGCVQNLQTEQARGPINISVAYDLHTLDPHARTMLGSYVILSNFYEPLISTDSALKARPCLAARWENPDSLTWIFHLRPSVRFHDGKPLTAEDVVYSFDRLMKNPKLEVSLFLTNVTGVDALDSNTIRIRTKKPVTIFLSKISFIMIIPKGSEDASLSKSVNGTGPYRFASWNKGERIELKKNSDYWGKKAEVENVNFYVGRMLDGATQDLASAKSQLVYFNSKKLTSLVKDSSNYRLILRDGLFIRYLGFDLVRDTTPRCSAKKNPFMNQRVRQAIHLAINRDRMVAQMSSYGSPASQPVPPYIFGYNPEITLPTYDLSRARTLMKEAGYADGFTISLHVREFLKETGEYVREQLKQISITVDLIVLSDQDFFQALRHGEVSFFLSRIGATCGDASDVFEGVFHTLDENGRYGMMNFGGYSNREMDRLIERSSEMIEVVDRRTTMQHMMELVMQELPIIPLYSDQDVYAIHETLDWEPRVDSHIIAADFAYRIQRASSRN